MVRLYDSMLDEFGHQVTGRTKLFIMNVEKNGSIGNYLTGTACVPETSGTMFIVDEWLISQIDKLLFIDGELIVKDGETIDEPVKSEKELQREELLKQLAELESQSTE